MKVFYVLCMLECPDEWTEHNVTRFAVNSSLVASASEMDSIEVYEEKPRFVSKNISLEVRIGELEKLSHVPFDFTELVKRLEVLEGKR